MEIADVKRCLGQMARWKGGVYRFTACVLRRGADGLLFYQAELTDERSGGNALVFCRLDEVDSQK